MLLPKIYPITDTGLADLSHAEQTKALVNGGATIVQLREKHASSFDYYEAARETLQHTENDDVKIIINDRVDIALAVNAHGVHLGQDDLSPAHARDILGENAVIGLSTHSVEQALDAMDPPIDYIAIGPVFETLTKSNAEEVVGLDGVFHVRQSIGEFPLVAIGGINSLNFRTVLDAGADSVAVIGDLFFGERGITAKMEELLTAANG